MDFWDKIYGNIESWLFCVVGLIFKRKMAILFLSRAKLTFEANQWFFFLYMQISVKFSFHATGYLYRYFSSVMVSYYFFFFAKGPLCLYNWGRFPFWSGHWAGYKLNVIEWAELCCIHSKKENAIIYSLSRNGLQVLHVICEFRKCGFILMQPTILDQFQLIALGSMWSGCWLIERDREKRE